jgi:hypothetical protein
MITLVDDAGYWILDAGYWMLDWMLLDAGCWILDTGYWILDAGGAIATSRPLGNAGCWVLGAV